MGIVGPLSHTHCFFRLGDEGRIMSSQDLDNYLVGLGMSIPRKFSTKVPIGSAALEDGKTDLEHVPPKIMLQRISGPFTLSIYALYLRYLFCLSLVLGKKLDWAILLWDLFLIYQKTRVIYFLLDLVGLKNLKRATPLWSYFRFVSSVCFVSSI